MKKIKIEGQKRKKAEQEKENQNLKNNRIDFAFAETKIIEMRLKKMIQKVEDVEAKDYLEILQNEIRKVSEPIFQIKEFQKNARKAETIR